MNYGKALAMCAATLVAAVAIGAAASPVRARPPHTIVVVAHPEELVTRRISYADLNLASAPGERTLNRRVGYAVSSLCNEAVGGDSTSFVYRDCDSGAWRGARPQISVAVERAREIASTGSSLIAATAITIALPR
jgi:UrcA family protein